MLRDLRVRIGYGAGTGLSSVSAVRDEAIWAEAVGFESFWVSQVFGVDPIVALAAVGDAVPDLAELGTSVVPLTGRHPLALAAQVRTAQSAVDGRFTLGVGASHQMVTEGFFGEPYSRAFSRTSEFLKALTPLLHGAPTDVEGDHIFAKGWLAIEAEPVPLLLAALGPRMLELAVASRKEPRSVRVAHAPSPPILLPPSTPQPSVPTDHARGFLRSSAFASPMTSLACALTGDSRTRCTTPSLATGRPLIARE